MSVALTALLLALAPPAQAPEVAPCGLFACALPDLNSLWETAPAPLAPESRREVLLERREVLLERQERLRERHRRRGR